jgi:hypothetical protein
MKEEIKIGNIFGSDVFIKKPYSSMDDESFEAHGKLAIKHFEYLNRLYLKSIDDETKRELREFSDLIGRDFKEKNIKWAVLGIVLMYLVTSIVI